MASNDSISEKQAYLRTVILEAGYDGDKFAAYLERAKKDGGNIENWTLDELKAEVVKYKRYFAMEDTPQKKYSLDGTPKFAAMSVASSPSPESKIFFPVVAALQFTRTIRTQRPETTLFGTKAKIVDIKPVNPGIFWRTYVVFDIETQEKDWKVQRKESDFCTLRTILTKMYPGYIIPPLPKTLLTRFDPFTLTKRMYSLQTFLDELLTHPVLSTAELVKAFLEVPAKEFEDKKATFETSNPPKSVSECFTSSGIATVSFDRSLSEFCSKVSDSVGSFKDKFKELKGLNLQLAEHLMNASNTMDKISAIHSELASKYQSLNAAGMSELHGSIKELFAKCTCVTKQFEGRIKEHFMEPIRHKRREMDALDELMTKWHASKAQVLVLKNKLKEKKSQLFDKKLVSQWQLAPDCKYSSQDLLNSKDLALKEMLPRETKEVEKHKETYGYYSNKVQEEFQRMCARDQNRMIDRLKAVANANEMDLEQMHKIMKEFINGIERARCMIPIQ